MTMRILYVISILLILIGLAPLFGLLFGLFVTEMTGCAINEGTINECILWGLDWGPFLTYVTVLGWLMILSWPIAGAGGLMLLVLLFVSLSRRLKPNGDV